MVLNILTYIIIFTAFGAFLRNVLVFFNIIKAGTGKSTKCAGCYTGCEFKEISPLNKKISKKVDQYRFYL